MGLLLYWQIVRCDRNVGCGLLAGSTFFPLPQNPHPAKTFALSLHFNHRFWFVCLFLKKSYFQVFSFGEVGLLKSHPLVFFSLKWCGWNGDFRSKHNQVNSEVLIGPISQEMVFMIPASELSMQTSTLLSAKECKGSFWTGR